MEILITGKNGFIGSHLVESLSQNYKVVSTSKEDLDLTDPLQVQNFLSKHNFDLIINTTTVGGKSGVVDNSDVLHNNISSFFNILKYKLPTTKLFTFTSGYELDKTVDHTGKNSNYVNYYPLDYYGMSKNIISRISSQYSDIYTFRLFGVYGEYEKDNRFIKKSILKYINHQPLHIIQNRYLDFIYVKDIIKIVKYYINNLDVSLDPFIEVVPFKKYTLVDIANIINNLNSHKVSITVDMPGMGLGYAGNGEKFSQIVPNYSSPEVGIKAIYNYINSTL